MLFPHFVLSMDKSICYTGCTTKEQHMQILTLTQYRNRSLELNNARVTLWASDKMPSDNFFHCLDSSAKAVMKEAVIIKMPRVDTDVTLFLLRKVILEVPELSTSHGNGRVFVDFDDITARHMYALQASRDCPHKNVYTLVDNTPQCIGSVLLEF
jgi:hypothetical protein